MKNYIQSGSFYYPEGTDEIIMHRIEYLYITKKRAKFHLGNKDTKELWGDISIGRI